MGRNEAYNRLFTGKISVSTFLQVYALHLLSRGEKMCGKDICNRIEARFKGAWNPSHGMIYPMLRQMEAKHLLKAKWEDDSKKTKRLYWITDEGREELREQLRSNESLFKETLGMMIMLVQDLY